MMQKVHQAKGSTAAILLLLLTACAPAPRGNPPLPQMAEALKAEEPSTARRKPELPPEVAATLLPPLSGGSTEMGTSGEPRFDVSAQKTLAREFFMGLVEGTPYNMVVHPDVEGKVSLSLKNVTVPEVMETVRNVYGYPYRRTASGFQVLPAGLQSRVFYVNYLNLFRRGISQTRVSSGQVTEATRESSDNGEKDKSKVSSVSGSRIDTESNSDFWRELEAALRAMIGGEEGRKVVIQPQAGVVVVRAMPQELQEVENYLTAIQGNLQRQVILEAKILEVELSDGYQSGINWASLARLGNGKSAVFGQTGGGTFFNQGSSEIAGNIGNLNPFSPNLPSGTNTSAFGGVFSTALNLGDFTGFIELLETQGNVQVLSSPRIATVNNQKAVIKVGSDEFFVTDIDTETTVTTTVNPVQSTDVTLTPFFSGIALDVTPQIDPEGRIILHIHPTVSQVVDQTKTISTGGTGDDLRLPLALSSVRESDSIVSALSGQLVVIGGLMENRMVKDNAAVPWLGRIPGLGKLFQHEKMTSRKSELVILLRPLVVHGNETWQNALNGYQQSFQQFGRQLDGN